MPSDFPVDCLDDLKAVLDYWWERRAGGPFGVVPAAPCGACAPCRRAHASCERPDPSLCEPYVGKESANCTQHVTKMYEWLAKQVSPQKSESCYYCDANHQKITEPCYYCKGSYPEPHAEDHCPSHHLFL